MRIKLGEPELERTRAMRAAASNYICDDIGSHKHKIDICIRICIPFAVSEQQRQHGASRQKGITDCLYKLVAFTIRKLVAYNFRVNGKCSLEL